MESGETKMFNETHFWHSKKKGRFHNYQTKETNVPLESGLIVISPSVTVKKKLSKEL